MDIENHLTTQEKVQRLNLDPEKFGTFAEIGAGQEVAARFFRAAQSSATVAKSISAYDMSISDALYGKTNRYVSRERLISMLDREYDNLLERLGKQRDHETTLFVFADTVAAQTPSERGHGHGWMGIRFQTEPKGKPSEIVIHVRLLDPVSKRVHETLGIMGVNLIHAAFYQHQKPQELIGSLMDELSRVRIEVNMIKFSGPAFADVDNRLMSLQLVAQELTDVAMFAADGEVVEPSEILYKRPVLIERGSFRPVTNVTMQMLKKGKEQLYRDEGIQEDGLVALMEMSLNNLVTEDVIDHRDFLARVDVLGALGSTVMISSYTTFERVTGFLRNYTQERIGMILGVATLREIMQEKYYEDREGGILEAAGRLFRGPVSLYVYPMVDCSNGKLVKADDLKVSSHVRHLYTHLLDNGFIQPIREFDREQLDVMPKDVLAKIQSADPSWEELVPPKAAALIKQNRLFGYRPE